MVLEMRGQCEKCESPPGPGGEARIGSFECTCCAGGARAMSAVCPTRGGKSLRRPRERAASRF